METHPKLLAHKRVNEIAENAQGSLLRKTKGIERNSENLCGQKERKDQVKTDL